MRTFKHTTARGLATGALSVTLALSCSMLAPASAWADDVETAQITLAAAESQMSEIVAEYGQLEKDIAESQKKIDQTTEQAMNAQQAMLEGRSTLGKVMKDEYSSNTLGEMLTLLLSSESFTELLRNVDYANAVMTATSDEIEAQRERKEAYDAILTELNGQRDDQELRLNQAEEKKAEAQRVVDQATANLANAEEEEAARLQALAEQAAQLQAEQEAQQQTEISANWNTDERDDAAANSTATESAPAASEPADTGATSGAGNGASSGGSQATVDTSTASGWQTGVASAYGGSSDGSVSNPAYTATGAICDDYSMGVAIPMSWANYGSYLGRQVEINYNGMTVIATVTDCGGMGGGSRSLDLQPGVFKAFGFNTCQEWGVRSVSYRFL